jgi:transposase
MDNALFHRNKRLMEICAKANGSLLSSPPYSPDLDPIEKDQAAMKRCLRDKAPLNDLESIPK